MAFYRLDRVQEDINAVGFDNERIETAIKYNIKRPKQVIVVALDDDLFGYLARCPMMELVRML